MRRPIGRDDALDDAHQRVSADEARRHGGEQAVALDVDLLRAVHHDFADGVVVQVGLDRAVAHDLRGDFLDEGGALDAVREPNGSRGQDGFDCLRRLGAQICAGEIVERCAAEQIQLAEHEGLQLLLERRDCLR